jgi:hypothetical protein
MNIAKIEIFECRSYQDKYVLSGRVVLDHGDGDHYRNYRWGATDNKNFDVKSVRFPEYVASQYFSIRPYLSKEENKELRPAIKRDIKLYRLKYVTNSQN